MISRLSQIINELRVLGFNEDAKKYSTASYQFDDSHINHAINELDNALAVLSHYEWPWVASETVGAKWAIGAYGPDDEPGFIASGMSRDVAEALCSLRNYADKVINKQKEEINTLNNELSERIREIGHLDSWGCHS